MTREEAERLAKTGKYKNGPIWCIGTGGFEDASPGHPLSCNCSWCECADKVVRKNAKLG